MHCTLPPLLGRDEKSLLAFLVTGKATLDLRPVNGAAKLAWVEVVRLTVAMAEEEMEAI